MKISPLSIICLVLSASICSAQTYLEPILGTRIAMNNAAYKFFQVNVGAQYAVHIRREYEFILQAMLSMPIAKKGMDQAYTLNPSLPVSADAVKTIKPYTFSVSIGHRFTLTGGKGTNHLFAILYTGFINENIVVSYAYDKESYIILNPDKSQERLSIFVSAGLEYMHQLSKGRLFAQLTVATPPFGKAITYPSSFGYISPLCLNVGYSIPLAKVKSRTNK